MYLKIYAKLHFYINPSTCLISCEKESLERFFAQDTVCTVKFSAYGKDLSCSLYMLGDFKVERFAFYLNKVFLYQTISDIELYCLVDSPDTSTRK